jgi:hypothetical protein
MSPTSELSDRANCGARPVARSADIWAERTIVCFVFSARMPGAGAWASLPQRARREASRTNCLEDAGLLELEPCLPFEDLDERSEIGVTQSAPACRYEDLTCERCELERNPGVLRLFETEPNVFEHVI